MGAMISLLNLDRNPDVRTDRYASPTSAAESARETPQTGSPDTERRTLEEPGEFEIVLGGRQIASTSLVVIVLVAVVSAFSYLIGRSMTPKAIDAAPMVREPAAATAVVQANAPQSAPVLPKATPAATISGTPAPLFGEELAGKVYIQVGAVPKGVAAIWAEGLRTHGLDAFVAPGPHPGPNDAAWRVVIGPLPDPQSFERTKRTLDAMGVDTFGRRHEP
jgi:hypothetical protein